MLFAVVLIRMAITCDCLAHEAQAKRGDPMV